MSKREQALAWCVQVHEDVAKKLDETWPNDPLLLRCEKALGWYVNEIERLEKIAYPMPGSTDVTSVQRSDK